MYISARILSYRYIIIRCVLFYIFNASFCSALSQHVAQAVCANHVVCGHVVYPRACDLLCNPYYILLTPIT